MPGQGVATSNQYYSFDLGLVHIVAYNAEAFFWPEHFDEEYIARMYKWLEDDLRAANGNRAAVPWVVVHAHRPFYCVETEKSAVELAEVAREATFMEVMRRKMPKKLRMFGDSLLTKTPKSPKLTGHCEWEKEAARRGVPSQCAAANGLMCSQRAPGLDPELSALQAVAASAASLSSVAVAVTTAAAATVGEVGKGARFPIEALFYDYGVDVAFFGHEHAYERYYPVYDEQVMLDAGITFDRYHAPRATVHVTTGSGGNKNMDIGGKKPLRGACNDSSPWCAFQSGFDRHDGHSSDFTYGRLTVHNSTTLEWEQISAEEGGGVIDRFVIVAPTHGSFAARAAAAKAAAADGTRVSSELGGGTRGEDKGNTGVITRGYANV